MSTMQTLRCPIQTGGLQSESVGFAGILTDNRLPGSTLGLTICVPQLGYQENLVSKPFHLSNSSASASLFNASS
jgi:hypothetical protein